MYRLKKIQYGVGVEVDGSVLPIRQIIGIGRNYAAHAIEQGAEVPEHPMVFMKNINAAGLDGDEIVIPPIARDENFGLKIFLIRRIDICAFMVGQQSGRCLKQKLPNDLNGRYNNFIFLLFVQPYLFPLQSTFNNKFERRMFRLPI